MNIWKISISNIFHKPLYAFLSVFSLSISIGLLFGVQQLDASIKNQFEDSLGDIDMVLGAKGSPLQLVLSSVLHIDNPTGNIPLKEAQKISKDPMIESVVPISYGDNYKGFRIIGTTDKFQSLYRAQLGQGRLIEKSMEVILGSTVAAESNLKIGETFLSSHGLAETSNEVHHHPMKVVGIYKPTYRVIDRLIVTNLESIWDVHNHGEEEHTEQNPVEEREITSMLITFRNPMGLLTMPRRINQRTSMQAALPKYELERLFNFTEVGVKAISWIAYIILFISCITIFINLFKMVKERSFDLALMRTYGASNFQLIRIIAYEGFILIIISLIVGAIISQIALRLIFYIFKSNYKQDILLQLPYSQILQTVLLITVMVALAIALAISPIMKMNISKILSHEK